ncbi:hypothetical protein KCU95_g1091, partial [Aureobasidium melanogenum]
MPGATKGSKTHHCPLARKGNCRPPPKGTGMKIKYCLAHQEVCMAHKSAHLKTEPCSGCVKEAEEKAKGNVTIKEEDEEEYSYKKNKASKNKKGGA